MAKPVTWFKSNWACLFICWRRNIKGQGPGTSRHTSRHAETLPPPPAYVSLAVRLQVLMLSAQGSWRPVQNSYVRFYNTSSTLAWVNRKFQCCERYPAFFHYLKEICSASALHGHWLVAPTSHIIEVLDKQMKTFQDLLQFAYCPGVGVEDVIIVILQQVCSHLDKANSTVRIMLCSCAFNTIQPELLCKNLHKMQVDILTTTWIINYLTNWLKGCVSEKVVSSTGAPHGTVLSQFLFTLYTSNFQYNSVL